MHPPLLSINHATVRYLNNTLFTGLNFTVNQGEHWALIGASGSGKSALLQTIAGRFNISGGNIAYHFFEDYLKSDLDNPGGHITYHRLIALVEPKHHFKNLSNTSDFYYQQRYNSSDSEDAQTIDEYLGSISDISARQGYWTMEKGNWLIAIERVAHKTVDQTIQRRNQAPDDRGSIVKKSCIIITG